MSVQINFKELLRRKGCSGWVIDALLQDEWAREKIEDYAGYVECQPVSDQEVELAEEDGGGSLFSLTHYHKVLQGRVEILDEESEDWSAGSAYTHKNRMKVRFEPGAVVVDVFSYSTNTETYRSLTIYYREA